MERPLANVIKSNHPIRQSNQEGHKGPLKVKFFVYVKYNIWYMHTKWADFVDKSSHIKNNGVSILYDRDNRLVLEVVVRFKLPTSNNQAEYKAY